MMRPDVTIGEIPNSINVPIYGIIDKYWKNNGIFFKQYIFIMQYSFGHRSGMCTQCVDNEQILTVYTLCTQWTDLDCVHNDC